MKLFPAKCHERATLRKLWRQSGNSSLLPAKYWPLVHVIRGGLMLSLESQRIFQNLLLFFCFEFCFHWISMFHSTLSRETLRFSGNEIHCSPRDQSLSVNSYRARLSLNKMSTVIGWFLVMCPWSNSNVSRRNQDTIAQLLPVCLRHFPIIYITKHLMNSPSGN